MGRRFEHGHDRRHCPKAHRVAIRLLSKRGASDQRGRLFGRTKGGITTKPRSVTYADGRPSRCFMTEGQISDNTAAAALLDSLPSAEWLLADRGYDADWCRDTQKKDTGIKPRIPGRRSRSKPGKYDKRLYKRRNRIEIIFVRLKD